MPSTVDEENMERENPLRNYLNRLNQQYNLSAEFKSRVASLIERLSDLSLGPEQIELLAGKVRDTYERQVLIETCREESKKSLQKIQGAINAYSNALSDINRRLNQAETALENVLKSAPAVAKAVPEKGILPFDKEKARALMAFASMNSKNSRIN
jgi:chromosome segregation ATPase